MSQPKLRRAAASAVLVSALALLPADAALAVRSPQPPRSQSPVAVPLAGSFWDLVTGLLRKFGSSINPDGRDARLSVDSNGNRTLGLDGSH